MNCGPGSIGGCFVHDNHNKARAADTSVASVEAISVHVDGVEPHFQQTVVDPPRFAGWWGHRLDDRFLMAPQFIPCEGVDGYRLSNPPVLLIAGARASLDLFDKVIQHICFLMILLSKFLFHFFLFISINLCITWPSVIYRPTRLLIAFFFSCFNDQAGIDRLRKKSILMTSYLEYLLITEIGPEKVLIFTPSDPNQRGCQLSISFQGGVESTVVNKLLLAGGVICDERKPNVMRVAPAPLYNSFVDIYTFIQLLKTILENL